MDSIERLNLAEECDLAAYDLMTISAILKQPEGDLNDLVRAMIALRARRTAKALMALGAAFTPATPPQILP